MNSAKAPSGHVRGTPGETVSPRRSAHPFVSNVSALRRQPGARQDAELAAPLEGLFVSSSRVPPGAEIRLSAVLESCGAGVLVTGTILAPWEGECRRCLEHATGELVIDIVELCAGAGDEETSYPLEGDELDLEPVVHDACILALPLAPLCSAGCLGLCPECGANRNLEPCSCSPSPDRRWAALAALAPAAGRGATRSGERTGRPPADAPEPTD